MRTTLALILVAFIVSGCSLFSTPDKTKEIPIKPSPITLVDQTPSPTPDPETQFAQMIADLLVSEETLAAGEISLSVTQVNESFAYGRFDHTYEKIADQAYWYARSLGDTDWEIVYWGQDAAACTLLDRYNFGEEFTVDCEAS